VGVENKDRLVRYWLGDLSEGEKLCLEKECLTDDQLSEALQEAENDLLDSYVCGELSEKQRIQFEQNYLDSPEKHKQIEVVRLLMNPAVRHDIAATAIPIELEARSWWRRWASFFQTSIPAVRLATVAVGIVIAALVVLLIIQNHRLRMELDRLEAKQNKLHQQLVELQRNANAPSIAGTPTGNFSGAERVLVSALLKPGLSRKGGNGNGNPPLTIPSSSSSVVLLLDLASDRYPRYSVVVETAEGKIIHHVQDVSSKSARGGRIIAVPLPAQSLPRGDYIVTISGARSSQSPQVVDSYAFSVSR
jgi:hypothetical protein